MKVLKQFIVHYLIANLICQSNYILTVTLFYTILVFVVNILADSSLLLQGDEMFNFETVSYRIGIVIFQDCHKEVMECWFRYN